MSAIDQIRQLRQEVIFGLTEDDQKITDDYIIGRLDQLQAQVIEEQEEIFQIVRDTYVHKTLVAEAFLSNYPSIAGQMRRLIALDDSTKRLRRVG